MTRIADLLEQGRTVSFEFFPPQTEQGDANLRDTLRELEPLKPSFVSVTYGAGGSTRERTHRIVVDLLEHTSMTPMAHLTGYAHTRDELVAILERYRDAGVENILALRGDPPADDPDVDPGDLGHALELVSLVRSVGDFSVGVAAHPELHPLSESRESDRRHHAAKLAAADFGITQLFLEAAPYLQMVEELAELGCTTPIIPGIMPVTNVRQIERMAAMSGAAFPAWLADRLNAVADDPAEVRRIGVEVATAMCQELLDAGAPGLHYFTLNRSTATREIHAQLSY